MLLLKKGSGVALPLGMIKISEAMRQFGLPREAIFEAISSGAIARVWNANSELIAEKDARRLASSIQADRMNAKRLAQLPATSHQTNAAPPVPTTHAAPHAIISEKTDMQSSHHPLKPGVMPNPLAAKLLPHIVGKKATILGVIDGTAFYQWWETIRKFNTKKDGVEIRTDLTEQLQSIEAALVYLDEEFITFEFANRENNEKHNGNHNICVSVCVVGESIYGGKARAYTQFADIIIRAEHIWTQSVKIDSQRNSVKSSRGLNEWVDDLENDREQEEQYGVGFVEIMTYLRRDIFGFSKQMLSLEECSSQGLLRSATGANGSACARLRKLVATGNNQVDDWFISMMD